MKRIGPTIHLSTEAARRLIDDINCGAANVRSLLLQLHAGEGWLALGYKTWDDCVESEFAFSRRRANQQLVAATIEQRLSGGNNCSRFVLRESHARELAAVPENRQLEVYRRALETSPNGLTAEHIRLTIAGMGFRRRPSVFDDETGGPTMRRFQSSGTHQTPVELHSAIAGRFDLIEIDLAANHRNAVVPRFISKKENALRRDWTNLLRGKMGYLNPPFDPVGPWIDKAVEEAEKGARFVMLCQASIDADWFWQMFPLCAVYALSPRIKFVGHTAGFPKALILCAFNLLGHGVAKREVGHVSRWLWQRENDQRLVRTF
jgi:phage N-6-adenine-methyltransferase